MQSCRPQHSSVRVFTTTLPILRNAKYGFSFQLRNLITGVKKEPKLILKWWGTTEPKLLSLDTNMNLKGSKRLHFCFPLLVSYFFLCHRTGLYYLSCFQLYSFPVFCLWQCGHTVFDTLWLDLPLFLDAVTILSCGTWERAMFPCTIHREKLWLTSESHNGKVWKPRVLSREVSIFIFYVVVIVWFIPSWMLPEWV